MKSQGVGPRDPQLGNGKRPGARRPMVAALVAVALVTALLLWVSQAILAHNRLQNCIDSGRRDCLPAETGSGS